MDVSYNPKTQVSGSALEAAQESPLGRRLFFLVTQLEYELQSRVPLALAELELDVRQYATLAYIAGGHTPTQLELAKVLRLDPSQVVTLVKGLVARGLIIRQTVPHDRRARAVVITREGKRLYERATVLVQRVEEDLTASLSRRDTNALRSLLERILPLH